MYEERIDGDSGPEGAEGAENAGVQGQEASQGQEVQEQPGTEGRPQITLDESGELNIPDSFWDSVQDVPADPADPADPTEPAEPEGSKESKADYYTPEELAEALATNVVDPAKLEPSLKKYWDAAEAAKQRQAAPPPFSPAQPQVPPLPSPQQFQAMIRNAEDMARLANSEPQMTKDQWEQLGDAARSLAVKNYLGIKPGEFDEFNPEHSAARNIALAELRDRARALWKEDMSRRAASARQEVQRVAESARFHQESARRRAAMDALEAEFRKTPEADEISSFFQNEWLPKQTVKEGDAVMSAFRAGDAAKLRALWNRVTADYKAAKAPRRKAAPPPPEVMGARGGVADGEEPSGLVDVSQLREMTPEEQSKFLIRNKFVV